MTPAPYGYPHTGLLRRRLLAMTGNGIMGKQYCVYIMTNKRNTVLYTGVTSNLARRVFEHKNKLIDGFTKRYNVNKLVYYEIFDDVNYAIAREKQIKGGSRKKKIDLIENVNKDWKDLYTTLP
jgi:putative endonuclease